MKLSEAELDDAAVENAIGRITAALKATPTDTASVMIALAAVCVDVCLSNRVPVADLVEIVVDMHDTYLRKTP